MSQKISLSFLFLFLSLFNSSFLSAQKQNYSIEINQKIKSVENNLSANTKIEGEPNWNLIDRMKFYNAPGVSIAVIKDFKIEWVKGYGWADKDEQRPVTPSTLFQAGSISKSLNAIGLLKLSQEGKINLNNDINDYLISWKFPYDSLSHGKKITIANLLSHTAGLTVHGFSGYEKGTSIPTLPQILDGKQPANSPSVRSAFEPSLKYEYSGGGTTISQLILQDVTSKPYDAFMWENVLKPMGMNNSFYTQPPSKDKQKELATGYYNGQEVKGKYHIYPEQAAAGLWTTPTDLAKYIIETQLSLLGKSSKVLSQQTTTQRLTPYIDGSAAFGVFIENRGTKKYFTHQGVDEGFVSQYYGSLQDGNGVVVMTNTNNTAILNEIINSVATVYNWKDFYNPTIKKTIALNDTVLESYVGEYQLTPSIIISITKEAHQLKLSSGPIAADIYPESNTKFFLVSRDGQMEFIKNDKDVVTKLIVYQNGQNMDAVKIK
ncbi:serine hydrolase [Flavobacterium sp.]|uniref:serine hydrolase n=1 Tax=Flavobacterium sp. TaxID=239 RepID=UPI002C8E767D|nr:serine hydrolase [Flavobacterium sp.]HSD06066.1 serine hydrolase [Flavobacterium sp.]